MLGKQLDPILWRRVKLVFFFSASWIYTGTVSADLLTASERAWLNANPKIRVAPDPDFPPIEFFDGNRNYQGIAADYLALVKQKLDIHFTIVHLSSWNQVLKQAQSKDVDMFAAATSTQQREKYMSFTSPHLELPGVILVRNHLQQNLSLKAL